MELKSFSASLGYLPQKFGLLKGLTASEMLQYFAESRHLPRQGQQEEIVRCLEAVGLSDRADDKIRTPSGGMIRRLGVAQAILGDPEPVILDEPTAGLDPEERLRFKNMISAMTRDKTIILSTHIVEDVVMLCDHIIVLAKGEIAAAGSVDEIASLAEGHVYEVPPDREGELTAPYFVSQREEHRLRVLSGVTQPGQLQEPRVEDGYLCVVKELL